MSQINLQYNTYSNNASDKLTENHPKCAGEICHIVRAAVPGTEDRFRAGGVDRGPVICTLTNPDTIRREAT